MKRKVWKKIALIAAILVVVIGLLFKMVNMQRSLRPRDGRALVASLPIESFEPLSVRVADSVVFKVDTGSDISCITRKDLDRLKALGVKVTDSYVPTIGRGSDGHIQTALKRVVVDLPLEFFQPSDSSIHSVERNPEMDNALLNAEFVLFEGDQSCIGIGILQSFFVEYLYESGLIRLHTSRPEGYEDFAPMRHSLRPDNALWPGHRYYLDLNVDHVSDSYFLDTGLRKAALKLPGKKSEMSRRNLSDDTLISHLGHFPAKIDNVWVECGNRAGSQMAFYADNQEEDYSFNPFNLFTQDVLIDFPGSSIALHPYVVLPKRHFFERDTVSETM